MGGGPDYVDWLGFRLEDTSTFDTGKPKNWAPGQGLTYGSSSYKAGRSFMGKELEGESSTWLKQIEAIMAQAQPKTKDLADNLFAQQPAQAIRRKAAGGLGLGALFSSPMMKGTPYTQPPLAK